MLDRLSKGEIKRDSMSPRRRVVMRNLIMKRLVEYRIPPQDLYVLTEEGKIVLAQWVPKERKRNRA